MACNASKAPFLRVVAKRGFAAQASPRPVGKVAEVQTTTLANKIVVATAESTLPITRVSVVFRAGSRNESYDVLGASHLMRIAAGLSTKNSTGFAITRNIQQIGGNLTASSDREIFAYTIETTSDQIDTSLRYLQDVIYPAFKPWEISDSVARLKTQVKSVPPQVRAVELMHQAAFRTGLGNSVYCPKHQIGKLSSESLLHYVAKTCTANRCAIVGVGIDNNSLSGFAQSLELGSGDSKSNSANYYGGDVRKDTTGNIAHVAVCGKGGALTNPKDALAFAVLQKAVGAGAATKRGNINGSFGKAASAAAGDASLSFAALNASYTDAGAFGFIVSTDASVAGRVVEAVAKALKSGIVSADDVNRGKALLKASILEHYSVDSCLISEMGSQAALLGSVQSADALISAIDQISQSDVQQAAKAAGSSKLSIGAVGNLTNVPYASDLN